MAESQTRRLPGWPLDLSSLPVFFALLAAASTFSLGYLWNEDLWWYLASGAVILDTASIPGRDLFVYSLPEPAAWLTHSWLWTVFLAWLERALGLWALPVTSALITGGIVTLLFTRAKLDRFGVLNGLLTALVVLASNDRFALKAELPGWLLLVAYILCFERDRPLTFAGAILLASAQWLWSNLHGGYPLGILTAAAYSVGGFVQVRRSRRSGSAGVRDRSVDPPLPLWVVPLLLAASLATPGLAAARLDTALEVSRRVVEGSVGYASLPIVEWQSTFSPEFGYLRWIYVAFLGLGAASFFAGHSGRSLGRLLLFAGMAIPGAYAVRFLSGFTIAAALVIMGNLRDGGWPRLGLDRRVASNPAVALQALAMACFCVVMLAMGVATWESRAQFEVGQSEDHFFSVSPAFTCPGAADYIRDYAPPGPIFNEMGLGGYLIYRLHPKRRIFIDGRLLDASLVFEYWGALESREHWNRLDQRHGFETVVLSNLRQARLPLRVWLTADPAWRIAFVDPQAVVFVRKDAVSGPFERVIDSAGRAREAPFAAASGFLPRRWMQWASLPLLREAPLRLLNNYLGSLAELGLIREAEALATRVLAVAPDAERARAFRGYARLQLGRPRQAVGDLRQAVEARPKDLFPLLNYALALNRLGQRDAARQQLRKAEQLDPGSPGVQRVRQKLRGPPLDPNP